MFTCVLFYKVQLQNGFCEKLEEEMRTVEMHYS